MKKTICILFSAILVCACLAGCTGTADSQPSPKGGSEVVTKAETTAAQVQETDSTSENTEKTRAKETLPVKTAGNNTNLLTGRDDLPDNAVGKRPVAVMVNNHEDSMPQYGIDAADIIYEVPVEHGLTRLLAIYPDFINIPDICSVRSYRAYFPPLALGLDAFYIHWGEDQTMMDYYRSLNMDSYDGLNGGILFGRDQNRINWGYGLEHTSVFYGTALASAIERDGKRTDLGDNYKGKTAFSFYDSETPYTPDGSNGGEVIINYGDLTSTLKYDPEKQVYLKLFNGQPQIDGISQNQLNFTNVFVLVTPVKEREDELHKEIDWTGDTNNTGFYLTQGKMVPVTWEKKDEYTQFKFYDADGDELVVNQGRTYLTFCEKDMVQFN